MTLIKSETIMDRSVIISSCKSKMSSRKNRFNCNQFSPQSERSDSRKKKSSQKKARKFLFKECNQFQNYISPSEKASNKVDIRYESPPVAKFEEEEVKSQQENDQPESDSSWELDMEEQANNFDLNLPRHYNGYTNYVQNGSYYNSVDADLNDDMAGNDNWSVIVEVIRKEVEEINILSSILYPHTTKQIANMLRTHPKPSQKLYSVQECEKAIDRQLDQMEQFGYDFLFGQELTQAQVKKLGRQVKQFRRQVKLKYNCDSCKDKKWSSIVGTFQIIFTCEFERELKTQEYRFPFRLKHHIKIYQMSCLTCKKWVKPQIYQSQLEAVQKGFCLVIAKIVQQIPIFRHLGSRFKMADVHNHEESSCQACLKGTCFAKPRNLTEEQESLLQKEKEKRRKEFDKFYPENSFNYQ